MREEGLRDYYAHSGSSKAGGGSICHGLGLALRAGSLVFGPGSLTGLLM